MPTSEIDFNTIQAFFWTFLSIIGVILMIVTYTYITKLERIKCVCSEHPYRKFIKKYLMFAIIFLGVTAFIPPSIVIGQLGELYGFIYMIIKWVFVITTVIFFVYALQYVRYLAREKCKCSEDIRREVLYWWSITELVILGILVLLPVLLILINGTVSLAIVSSNNVLTNLDKTVMATTINPLNSVKKASKSLKVSMQKIQVPLTR